MLLIFYDVSYKIYLLENAFVVGARTHRTVESLTFNSWQWNIMSPYPSAKDVNSVKIVSYDRVFYVFGGYVNSQVTNDILSFENGAWSRVGSLTSKRTKFSVILNVDKIYVIGGRKTQKYELCTLSKTVDCERDSGIDFQSSEEPVLFGVSKDGPCDLTIPNYEPQETKELMILSNATFNEIEKFRPLKKTNYRRDNVC